MTDRERADSEAATWLVLLADKPDDAELQARFEAWRGASALNAEIWQRTRRAYDLLGQGTPLPAPRLTRRKIGTAAAAAALAAGLALAFLPGLTRSLRADVATGSAETRIASLPDGSEVILAPESALEMGFADGRRRVALLKGEAFFQVAPDPDHPFTVVAGEATATVLGTGFDVRRDGTGATVTVEHGHVRAEAAAGAEDLLAGDWAKLDGTAAPLRGKTASDEVALWRRRQFIARDQPAGAVIDALRRYYAGLILVRDQDFAARRVSGLYDLSHPERTLTELAAAHGATVRHFTPWTLIVTAADKN